jgi:hypothetical protein
MQSAATLCSASMSGRRTGQPLASKSSQLQFSYTSAWAIGGGFAIPQEIDRLFLVNNREIRVYISRGITDDLQEAISNKALASTESFGRMCGNKPDLGQAHSRIISEIREQIDKENRYGLLLCYQKSGIFDGDVDLSRCFGDSIQLCVDAFNDTHLREKAKRDINAIQLALSLHSGNRVDFHHLMDCCEYKNSLGQKLYPLKFEGPPARLYVGKLVDKTFPDEITELISQCGQASQEIPLTVMLYAKLIQREVDPLLAYIAGWAALDSLTERVYHEVTSNEWSNNIKAKKRALIDELGLAGVAASIAKFRLHFLVTTHFLISSDGTISKRRKIEECFEHYEKRNALIHDGSELDRVPSSAFLTATLFEYLNAYLKFTNNRQGCR